MRQVFLFAFLSAFLMATAASAADAQMRDLMWSQKSTTEQK
jgi:hypothetical protein